MKPTYEEYLDSHATWKRHYRGVMYRIAFWGLNEHTPHGMWNLYLHLPEQMFPAGEFVTRGIYREAERMRLTPTSPLRDVYNYRGFPFDELDLNGGPTFYEVRGEAPEREAVIGCDYNHLWDDERGHPEDLGWIEQDAFGAIDALLRMFPNTLVRCMYGGEWTPREDARTTVRGTMCCEEHAARMSPAVFPEVVS